MVAHETAFVHMSIHAVYMAPASVLPHGNVATVLQHRLSAGVLGYHNLVLAKPVLEVMVVEVGAGIDKRLLMVSTLHEPKKLEDGVSKFLGGQAATGLDVYHGQQVLVSRPALSHKIAQLHLLGNPGTVEVIRAHLEAVLMSQFYVALVLAVYVVAPLGGLEIHVSHLGVLANSLPEHIALIVAHIYTVDMRTGILALYLGTRSQAREQGEDE